jgi:hypothetical protein
MTEKKHKKTRKRRSYERTLASNFWVLWQPPIEIVTPYFRGLVPYGDCLLVCCRLVLQLPFLGLLRS